MCLNSVKIWKLQKKELSCPVWDLLFTVCLHDPIQRASLKSSLMFWMDYHPKMVQCLKQPHTVGFFWNGSLNNHSKIKTDYISKRQFNSHIMRCNSIAVTVHLWYSIACRRASVNHLLLIGKRHQEGFSSPFSLGAVAVKFLFPSNPLSSTCVYFTLLQRSCGHQSL